MAAGYDGSIRIDTRLDSRGFNRGVTDIRGGLDGIGKSLKKMAVAMGIVFGVKTIASFKKETEELYKIQMQNEVKLATVMRQRMGATKAQIQEIKDLASAEQALGIVGDEVQLAGAQQLATFLNQTDSLKKLIPAMNHLVAQQYGYEASAESARNVGNMMGKVFVGQVGALTRVGISFSKAEEQILKFGTEAQKAATLAQVIENNVGRMNYALANTDIGRQKQLSNTLGDIKEQFGQAFTQISVLFLPALNTMANILAKIANLARQVAQSIASLFGKQVKQQEQITSTAIAGAAAESNLADATKKAGKEAKGATAGFDELNVLQKETGEGSGTSGENGGMGGVAGGVLEDMEIGQEVTVSPVITAALEKLRELVIPLQEINLDNLSNAFDRLKIALTPIAKALFAGLEWAYLNLFVPLATWTIENVLPLFLDMLANAGRILTDVLMILQPYASWLWENFLKPLAQWTGGVIINVLEFVAEGLRKISDWISENKELVARMAITVALFFSAWEVIKLMAFIETSGGIVKALGLIAKAIYACTLAKIIDKGETVILTALYAKDFVLSLAASTKALTLNLVAWGKETLAKIASTTAQIIHNGIVVAGTAITWLATAATTAFSAAMAFLTSPIGLVVIAITALIAVAVLCIKHWDEIKVIAVNAWEAIKEAWAVAAEWFNTTIVQPIATYFTTLWENIKQWAANCWQGITEVWIVVSTWFNENIIVPVADFFKGLWDGIKKKATDIWEGIKAVWAAASGWFDANVVKPISTFFNGLWEGIKRTFSTAWGFMTKGLKTYVNNWIGIVERFLNFFINGINLLIKGINKIQITVPDWVPGLGGKGFKVNVQSVPTVQIPRLATGAYIGANNPMLAVVGDNTQHGEFVAPEDKLIDAVIAGVKIALAEQNTQRAGGDLVLKVGETELGRVALRALNTLARSGGNLPLKV